MIFITMIDVSSRDFSGNAFADAEEAAHTVAATIILQFQFRYFQITIYGFHMDMSTWKL